MVFENLGYTKCCMFEKSEAKWIDKSYHFVIIGTGKNTYVK